MALDDRERNFEKALKRELRANGASGLDCPDAETLAAYHERMLSPEEMVAQKSHIAACPRCQEILATLEITEAIPSAAEDSEKAFEKGALQVPMAVPAAPVFAKSPDLAGARAKSTAVREMPRRKTYLRWAVPTGAIAAGLLVWVAINTNRSPMKMKQSDSVQVAENREQKEAPLSVPKPMAEAPAPSSTMADKVTKNDRSYTKQELDALASDDQDRRLTRDKAPAKGRAGAPPAYDHGPRMMQNQTQNQVQNQNLSKEQIAAQNQHAEEFQYKVDGVPQAAGNGAAVTQNAPRRNEQAMKAAPATPPPPAPVVAGKVGEANGRKDADLEAQTQMVVVTGGAANAADEKKEEENAKAALKKLKTAPGFAGIAATKLRDTGKDGLALIATPDPKVFWIAGLNGVVVKTEDEGKTSRRQEIGEGIKVLAGSAVDTKTCWLIAAKGIVLRTVDGGKHWTTIAAPDAAEFTSIKAVDALRATITDASGKVRYSTSDAGATWVAALP